VKLELLSVLNNFLKTSDALVRVLELLLNLVNKIKIEDNGTLKPNNFDQKESHEFLLQVIETLLRYDKALNLDKKFYQNDSHVVSLLLKLIQNNDNSINTFDDSFYQAQLLKNMLKVINSEFFEQILKEVLRFLMIDFFSPSRKRIPIWVIFTNLSKFIIKNLKWVKHHTINENHFSKFSSIILHSDNQTLKEIFYYFQKLKKKYVCHLDMAGCVFLHKLNIKKHLKKFKLLDLLVYSLKYAHSQRSLFGSSIGNKILLTLLDYMNSKKEEIKKVKVDLSIETSQKLQQLLWEQMTCSTALADNLFQHIHSKLYFLFFGEFIPPHLIEEYPDCLFELDMFWLNYSPRFELETFFVKEKKYVMLNFLSLQKKKKNGKLVDLYTNHKYNIRDLLMQNFKTNKESLNKKSIAKQIVSILLTEKLTTEIENSSKEEYDCQSKSNLQLGALRASREVFSGTKGSL
jgi:hypothetical protein